MCLIPLSFRAALLLHSTCCGGDPRSLVCGCSVRCWYRGVSRTAAVVLGLEVFRRAGQELEVKIASVAHLANVARRTSERLLASDLAAKLFIAIVALFYVGFGHKGFAPSPDLLEPELLDAEEPEAAGRNLAGAKALFRFQLLLHVLDAGLLAVVLVVRTVVVPCIVAEVHSPAGGVILQILFGALCAARVKDGGDAAVFGKLEEISIPAIR